MSAQTLFERDEKDPRQHMTAVQIETSCVIRGEIPPELIVLKNTCAGIANRDQRSMKIFRKAARQLWFRCNKIGRAGAIVEKRNPKLGYRIELHGTKFKFSMEADRSVLGLLRVSPQFCYGELFAFEMWLRVITGAKPSQAPTPQYQ